MKKKREAVLVLALQNKLWLTTCKSLIQQSDPGIDTVLFILSDYANASD